MAVAVEIGDGHEGVEKVGAEETQEPAHGEGGGWGVGRALGIQVADFDLDGATGGEQGVFAGIGSGRGGAEGV